MTLGHLQNSYQQHDHRLNAQVPRPLAQPCGMLTLKEVKVTAIRHGGYKIEFHGSVPQHCRVRLLLGNSERYFIDITGGYKAGKRSHEKTHLEELLHAMERGGFWGTQVPVRAAIYRDGRMCPESLSFPRFIQCPIEPLETVGIEEIGAVKGLRYTGKHDASGEVKGSDSEKQPEEKTGTILSHAINGKYFFIYAGAFETDSARRGFDCTTYVGAAGGLFDGKGQGGTGQTVAEALGAESCDMEHKHPTAIKEFFSKHDKGTYVMWSHGHVVFVKDGFVHEFTDRVSRDYGYQKTKVAHWLTLGKHHKQTFSVRQLGT